MSDMIECPTCGGAGKLQVGASPGRVVYPPIGSIWEDNDPRMLGRQIEVIHHDPDNNRVAVRSMLLPEGAALQGLHQCS